MRKAFTLVELMVVVAIIALVSVVGGISLTSRMKTSRLEGAAQSLAADLAYARTAALFKGCHTRFIICMDRSCSDRNVSLQTGGFLGNNSGPARYYAILRRAQYDNIAAGCYFDPNPPNGAPDPSPASGGYFDEWDFDRKPQALPSGVVFGAIYRGAGQSLNAEDWSSTTDTNATNSLYFNASPNVTTPFVIPVEDSEMPDGLGRAAFQLSFDDCDPSDVNDDCTAYIISLAGGGEVNVTQCEAGTRANATNICF